jgi:hypothetical protein
MFELAPGDNEKISAWLQEVVYPPIIASQKLKNAPDSQPVGDEAGNEYPYEGAIGGGLTYSFTPTGLGIVIKVESYGQVLDLTDYGSW